MSSLLTNDEVFSGEGAVGKEAPNVGRVLLRVRSLGSSALLLVLLDLAVNFPHLLAARALALAIVLFLPGALAMESARVRFESRYVQFCAVLAASLVVIMAWAAIGSAVLPELGIAKPLSRGALTVAISVIIACLAALCPSGSDPVLDQFHCRGPGRIRPWHLVALLPALAIAGVERLNNNHGSALVQATVGAVAFALIVGFLQARAGRHVRAQVLLFCASLALAYLYSYRSNHLLGYDIQDEYQRFSYTFSASRWTPSDGDPYAAMLSITALPAALAKLTSISGLYLFKGLYPIFLAFVPGLVYEVVARWITGRAAFIGAAYMVILPGFAGQLTGLARQETGFLFFALLVVVLFAPELALRRRQATIGVVLAGLVVSHYSTSYVAVVMLGSTWLVYMVLRFLTRLRGGRRLAAPAVSLVTVALGVMMVLAWDVWITDSSSNVTGFMSSLADKGVEVLPFHQGGSIVERYLVGNVAGSITPAEYYARAEQASRESQPWLYPFPPAVADKYPAQAAPSPLTLAALVPNSATVTSDVVTVLDQALLALIVVGVALTFFDQRRRPPPVPLEAAVLAAAFLAFLVLIRISGTVAGSYGAARAQLQAAIVLAVALGLSAEWIMTHLRLGSAPVAVALLATLFNGIGETVVITGGDAPVLLANSGTGYDYFVISDGEVSAARWLIALGGPHPLIYTDLYGPLRISGATSYLGQAQTWLTPGTLNQGAWVFASAYSVVDDRAYGAVDGYSVTYRFPARFLGAVDNLVYSDPTARVYR